LKMSVRTHLFRRLLRASVLAQLLMYGVVPSHAGNLTACVDWKVTFDGITRLDYATVKASSGPRLYLHASYPERCASGSEAPCPARAYLVPGNAVAIGKGCGKWAYVQYIGEKVISEGWVESDALQPIAPPPPPRAPVIRVGREVFPSPAPRRYSFQPTKGRGTPLCEAYLQRLNQTDFYSPPYCGRPESTVVPGFRFLQRRFLSSTEYRALFFDASAVLTGEPLHHDYIAHRNSDGSSVYVAPYDPLYPGFTPGAWTYDPPIDIENAGGAGNVILWTVEDRYHSDCGTASEPDGGLAPGSLYGLVLSHDLNQINREKTYAVFGIPGVTSGPPPTVTEFGRDFGVFEYRDHVYFDTVFDRNLGDAAGHRGQEISLSATLGVFLYNHGRRHEVCEYYISNLGERP
jgi:hypothetical protein